MFNILIFGSTRWNSLKQTDISIFVVTKKKRNIFVPNLCKLEGKFFHNYKMYCYLLIAIWYALALKLQVKFVRHAFHLWFLLIFYEDL